jgi:hypothetical protein
MSSATIEEWSAELAHGLALTCLAPFTSQFV